LSARWRRSRKNRERFSFLKAFDGSKRRACQFSEVDEWRIREKAYPSWQRVRRTFSKRRMKEPEPLLDVIESHGEIIVVAEFAGFNKDSLKIRVDRHRLTLRAQDLDRRYYKSLNLPKRVIPNTIRTTCKNGVLEIQLKKALQDSTLNRVAD
jgi:HSP20 family molecular chaperone IbpA